MVDLTKLASLMTNLRESLRKLGILATIPEDGFLQDFTKVESAKYLLQV